jgi:hypothetical protein
MNIQEFRYRFVSRKEESVLFDALRRLSRITDLKTVVSYAWTEWPSGDGPGEHALVGRI